MAIDDQPKGGLSLSCALNSVQPLLLCTIDWLWAPCSVEHHIFLYCVHYTVLRSILSRASCFTVHYKVLCKLTHNIRLCNIFSVFCWTSHSLLHQTLLSTLFFVHHIIRCIICAGLCTKLFCVLQCIVQFCATCSLVHDTLLCVIFHNVLDSYLYQNVHPVLFSGSTAQWLTVYTDACVVQKVMRSETVRHDCGVKRLAL